MYGSLRYSSNKKPFIWCRVPKVGTTSWNILFIKNSCIQYSLCNVPWLRFDNRCHVDIISIIDVYQSIFYRNTTILYIAQNIKLTLKAHIYPLAQLLNNTHDLELQHKMKMPRLNSWSHLFASWKK